MNSNSRSHRPSESFNSRYGTSKVTKTSKTSRSFRDHSRAASVQRSESTRSTRRDIDSSCPPTSSALTSAIVTLCVGPEQRLFASHEENLSRSPFFDSLLRSQFLNSSGRTKRIDLPDESPEVLSSILEYLYKGDYYPKLLHNKRKDTWELEDDGTTASNTIFHPSVKQTLMKDTVIYCSAQRYSLPDLQRLALRKQGLHTGMQISVILASARFAYDNTPNSDSKLRAQYLTLIIRSRGQFKGSGTMKMEMERGGTTLFFDLFVAMCNHMDDLKTIRSPFSSPFTR